MTTTIKLIAPWLAAAGIAGAIAAAPLANADTDPCTPYGTVSISPCTWTDNAQDNQRTGMPF